MAFRHLLVAAAVLTLLTVACDGSTDPGSAPPENTIGPEGGTLVVDNLTLRVPAGALTEEVAITAQPVSSGAGPEGFIVVDGTRFDLAPDGLTFDAPVQIAIAYHASALPEGFSESEVGMLRMSGQATRLESAVGGGTVTAHTDHFSEFAVAVPSDEYQRITCDGFSPAISSGLPLERIALGPPPEQLEAPLAARVEAEGVADPGFTLVTITEVGTGELVVPVHPSTSPDGGSVRVTVTDGSNACAPFDFTIAALPPAPGELAAIADLLQEILREQAAAFETTPEEIVGTSFQDLPESLMPLALLQSTLDHPENPESLSAIAAGTSPNADSARLDLMEPLLARTGVREELASTVSSLRQARMAGDARHPSVSTPGARTLSAIDAGLCEPDVIGDDPGLLDRCMSIAAHAAFRRDGASGKVLEDLGNAFNVVGALPAMGPPATVAGFVSWMLLNDKQRNAGLLPSALSELRLTWDPVEFLEDQPGPGTWHATVTATSEGWDQRVEALEGALASGAMDKVHQPGWVAGNVIQAILKGPVADGIRDSSGGDEYEIEPAVFGPVIVTDEKWSMASVAAGDAIALGDGHNEYDPVRHGSAILSVRTADGKFGGQQLTALADVGVKQLRVTISPDEVHLKAGEVQDFTVRVIDAVYPQEVERDMTKALQGTTEPMSYVVEELSVISYTAPEDPNHEVPDLLTVQSTATTGARNQSDEDRTATATIRFGEITISPRSECLEVGETLQFEAEVKGLDDEAVEWTASIGEIDDATGHYTATESGTATIAAAAVANPDLEDEVNISVGGCTCSWTVSVDGNTFVGEDFDQATVQLSADGGAIESIAVDGVENSAQASFTSAGSPLAIGTTGSFPVVTFGEGYISMGPEGMSVGTTAHITENTEEVLAGTIDGTVWFSEPLPDGRVGSFSMSFLITTDPLDSTETTHICTVGGAPGGNP